MTYSLNTLHSTAMPLEQPVRVRALRFAQEITLIVGFVVLASGLVLLSDRLSQYDD